MKMFERVFWGIAVLTLFWFAADCRQQLQSEHAVLMEAIQDVKGRACQ